MGQRLSSKNALPTPSSTPDYIDWETLNEAESEALKLGLRQLTDVISKIVTGWSEDRIVADATPSDSYRGKVSLVGTPNLKTLQALSDDKDTTERTYLMQRAPHELPDPSQPRKAEINQTGKKIGARVSPEHLELFNEVAEQFFTKREAMEAAIELLAAEKLDYEI